MTNAKCAHADFFNLDYLSSVFRFRALMGVLDAHSRLQERSKRMSNAQVDEPLDAGGGGEEE